MHVTESRILNDRHGSMQVTETSIINSRHGSMQVTEPSIINSRHGSMQLTESIIINSRHGSMQVTESSSINRRYGSMQVTESKILNDTDGSMQVKEPIILNNRHGSMRVTEPSNLDGRHGSMQVAEHDIINDKHGSMQIAESSYISGKNGFLQVVETSFINDRHGSMQVTESGVINDIYSSMQVAESSKIKSRHGSIHFIESGIINCIACSMQIMESSVVNSTHGYVHVKSAKTLPLCFQKTWYKVYLVLRCERLVLEQYENESLENLIDSHNIEYINLIKTFYDSKSRQYAVILVLQNITLFLGSENLALLDQWLNSFLQIKKSLRCRILLHCAHVRESEEMFDVSVIETKLSKKILLNGSYFMYLRKFKILLYSKIDYSEVQRWPLSCILHYSSQVNNKELIFLIKWDSGFGILRFTSSAFEEMDLYFRHYTDKLRLTVTRPFTVDRIKNDKRDTKSLKHFFCYDCKATDKSKCSCWCSNHNCNKCSTKHKHKSCNKIIQDDYLIKCPGYIDPDISNIDPRRLDINKNDSMKHQSSRSYDNEDNTIASKNAYLELIESVSQSGNSSSLYNNGILKSGIRKTSKTYSLPISSPEFKKKRNLRRSSEPYRPVHIVYKALRNVKSFEENSKNNHNKVHQKLFSKNSFEKTTLKLKKYISKQTYHIKKLTQQLLNQNVRLVKSSTSIINTFSSIPETTSSSISSYEYFCTKTTKSEKKDFAQTLLPNILSYNILDKGSIQVARQSIQMNDEIYIKDSFSDQVNHIFENKCCDEKVSVQSTSFEYKQTNWQPDVGENYLVNIQQNDVKDKQVIFPSSCVDYQISLQTTSNYLSQSGVINEFQENGVASQSDTNISTQINKERNNIPDLNFNKMMDSICSMNCSERIVGLNKSSSLPKLFCESSIPFPQPKKKFI